MPTRLSMKSLLLAALLPVTATLAQTTRPVPGGGPGGFGGGGFGGGGRGQFNQTTPPGTPPIDPPSKFPGDGKGGFATGKYRNYFLEIGKTQAEVDAKVQKAWDQLFH